MKTNCVINVSKKYLRFHLLLIGEKIESKVFLSLDQTGVFPDKDLGECRYQFSLMKKTKLC